MSMALWFAGLLCVFCMPFLIRFQFVGFIVLLSSVVVGGLLSCSETHKQDITTMEVRELLASGRDDTCTIDVMALLTPRDTLDGGAQAIMTYERRAWWFGQCATGALVMVNPALLAALQKEHATQQEAHRQE